MAEFIAVDASSAGGSKEYANGETGEKEAETNDPYADFDEEVWASFAASIGEVMQKRGDGFLEILPWDDRNPKERKLYEDAIETVGYQQALEQDTFGGWE